MSHRLLKSFVFGLSLLVLFGCLSISCHDFGSEDIPDGWLTSSPEAQGLDAPLLNELKAQIQSGTYGQIHSLVIVRHGYLVVDEYFQGSSREQLHPVYSVTKSATSLLVGIAKDMSKVQSINAKLLSFFPEYTTIANLDSNKRAITLADVLTMRAGFEWNELSVSYNDSRNPIHQLTGSSDWVKFMLDRQMSDPPGTRLRYNSGCTILLAGILRNTTGLSAEGFAKRNLFTPLGIIQYRWEMGPHNVSNTGWGLSLRPRDMAKVGFLVLKKGMWNGKRVISEDWITEATHNHVTYTRPYSYGYQWWMMPIDTLAGHTPNPDDIKIAWGWGDQFIFVIPKFDMVVVSTAGNYSPPDDRAIEFLRSYILRAVRG